MQKSWKMSSIMIVALCAGHMAQAADITGQQWPKRERSTIARMDPENLKAAAEHAQRHNAARVPVSLTAPGLIDFKSILHAHAEDSTHTGGTRPEMLEDAKKTGVKVIMLTNHIRPPVDFIDDSWRGLHDGVLFIPGAESQRLLVYPEKSVMHRFDESAPEEERENALIASLVEVGGFGFLCHVESRPDYPMDGLLGMEIYNRHADAKDDIPSMMHLLRILTDPALFEKMEPAIKEYPVAFMGAQQDYLTIYINKWDQESQHRRIVGIAANDCHHNQVFVAKKADDETVLVGTIVDDDDAMRKIPVSQVPSVKPLLEGRAVGEELTRLDLDPYWVSFSELSTHILATEQSEEAIREALRNGNAYISHDWLCDPHGTMVMAKSAESTAIMGDEIAFEPDMTIQAEFPVACHVRLLRNGELIDEQTVREYTFKPAGPGTYRLEAWLEINGEYRPWIYANPLYLR